MSKHTGQEAYIAELSTRVRTFIRTYAQTTFDSNLQLRPFPVVSTSLLSWHLFMCVYIVHVCSN